MGGGPIIIIDPKAAKGTKAKGPAYRYRSAVTGRFVAAGYSKRYPHLTIRQRIKPSC